MKILFGCEYFPPAIVGGGEVNAYITVKNLVKQGVEVIVLTSAYKNAPRYEIKEGFTIYRRLKTGQGQQSVLSNLKRSVVFPKSVVKEARNIIGEANRQGEKIKGIHLLGNALLSAKELSSLKVPLFATIESYPSLCPKGDRRYNGEEECKIVCSVSKFIGCQAKSKEIGKMQNKWYFRYNPFFLWYVFRHYAKLRKSLKYCNLIAISNYVQRLLQLHKQESKVISNAVEISSFRQSKDNKKFTKLSKDKKIILYLGSLIESKGPEVLVNALDGLQGYECWIYGKGPLQEKLQKIIDKKRLNVKIFKPVPYDEVPTLYQKAEIIVFPSVWPEPFGRISVEGLAAGKVVIGSAIGGIKETLEGKGILVPPGDVSTLHDALRKVIDQREKTKEKISKKETTKESSLQEYSPEEISKKLITMYKNKEVGQ